MGVIVEITLPSSEFELGRVLQMEGDANITLETMVPLGERSVPFFRVKGVRDAFENTVRNASAVADLDIVTEHDDEALYALDWDPSTDTFFRTVHELNAHLLEATGGSNSWLFELRMPSHDALSEFQQACFDAEIPVDVMRIYNPTRPDAGPWFGLTAAQRETLALAVEKGYYALPRGIATAELAEEFDISDQAITERLRRAIDTLTRNTLLLDQEEPSH